MHLMNLTQKSLVRDTHNSSILLMDKFENVVNHKRWNSRHLGIYGMFVQHA